MLRILFWPFLMIWSFLGLLLNLLGRFLLAVLGLILLVAGAILTITLIGAIVGIPLCILGVTLMVRSIF